MESPEEINISQHHVQKDFGIYFKHYSFRECTVLEKACNMKNPGDHTQGGSSGLQQQQSHHYFKAYWIKIETIKKGNSIGDQEEWCNAYM